MPHDARTIPASLRPAIEGLEPMKIAAIARYGREFGNVLPLWFGESDVPTPEFIRRAAAESLARGETFYEAQSGLVDLRQALADYTARLTGRPCALDRITVTASGMTGLHVAIQALLEPGSNMAVVTPAWPNIAANVVMMGAEPRRVALQADAEGRWRLDLDRVFAACDADTRAIFVNSPSNPTGWTCPREDLRAILDFARARGIWLIADEVYNRVVYDGPTAPSILEIAEPEDAVIAVNSFSKAWAMTGWRLGWITAPARIWGVLGNLVQYTNSSSPTFVQRAGAVAVREGEGFIREFVERCRRGREVTYAALARSNRIRAAEPEAAFYAFFAVEGETDSMELAKRLIREAGVGVAPGAAFGPEGEGWLRVCFAQSPEILEPALDRLVRAIG